MIMIVLSLSKTEGSMSSKPDKLYTIFLQMISKRGQSVRKYGWHGTAPRGRCEKVKNENSIICLVIVINILIEFSNQRYILSWSSPSNVMMLNFITVFVDFFQLKILASSHGPSCEWSRCLQEVFPVATHWWFRQTCTAGSEDHVFCVCFADFFWCWQISTQQDQSFAGAYSSCSHVLKF